MTSQTESSPSCDVTTMLENKSESWSDDSSSFQDNNHQQGSQEDPNSIFSQCVISEHLSDSKIKLREVGQLGAFPFSKKKAPPSVKRGQSLCTSPKVCKSANQNTEEEDQSCPHKLTFLPPFKQIIKKVKDPYPVGYDPHVKMTPHAFKKCPAAVCTTCGKALKGKKQCCMPTRDKFKFRSEFQEGGVKLEKKPQKSFLKLFQKKSMFETIVKKYEPDTLPPNRTEEFKRNKRLREEEEFESEMGWAQVCSESAVGREARPDDIRQMLFPRESNKEGAIHHKWGIDLVEKKEDEWQGPHPTPEPKVPLNNDRCALKPCARQHVTYPSKADTVKRDIKKVEKHVPADTMRICMRTHLPELPFCESCEGPCIRQPPKEAFSKSSLKLTSSLNTQAPGIPTFPCFKDHTCVRKSRLRNITKNAKPDVKKNTFETENLCQKHHIINKGIAKGIKKIPKPGEKEILEALQALPHSCMTHGKSHGGKKTFEAENARACRPRPPVDVEEPPFHYNMYFQREMNRPTRPTFDHWNHGTDQDSSTRFIRPLRRAKDYPCHRRKFEPLTRSIEIMSSNERHFQSRRPGRHYIREHEEQRFEKSYPKQFEIDKQVSKTRIRNKNKSHPGKRRVWEVRPLESESGEMPSLISLRKCRSLGSQISAQISKSLDNLSKHKSKCRSFFSRKKKSKSEDTLPRDESFHAKCKPRKSRSVKSFNSFFIVTSSSSTLTEMRVNKKVKYKHAPKSSHRHKLKKKRNKSSLECFATSESSSVSVKGKESTSAIKDSVNKDKKRVAQFIFEFLEWQKEKEKNGPKVESSKKKEKKMVKKPKSFEKVRLKKSLELTQAKKSEEEKPNETSGSSSPQPPKRKKRKSTSKSSVTKIKSADSVEKKSKEAKCPMCDKKNISQEKEKQFGTYYIPPIIDRYLPFFQRRMPQENQFLPQYAPGALRPDMRRVSYNMDAYNLASDGLVGYVPFSQREVPRYSLNEKDLRRKELQAPLDTYFPFHDEIGGFGRNSIDAMPTFFIERVYQGKSPLSDSTERYIPRMKRSRYRPPDLPASGAYSPRKPIVKSYAPMPPSIMRYTDEKPPIDHEPSRSPYLSPFPERSSRRQIHYAPNNYSKRPMEKGFSYDHLHYAHKAKPTYSQKEKPPRRSNIRSTEPRSYFERSSSRGSIHESPIYKQFFKVRDMNSRPKEKPHLASSEISPQEGSFVRGDDRIKRDELFSPSDRYSSKDKRPSVMFPQKELHRSEAHKPPTYPFKIRGYPELVKDKYAVSQEEAYQSSKSILDGEKSRSNQTPKIYWKSLPAPIEKSLTPEICERECSRLEDIPRRSFTRLEYVSPVPTKMELFNCKKFKSTDVNALPPPHKDEFYVRDKSFPSVVPPQLRDDRTFQRQIYRFEDLVNPHNSAATQTEKAKVFTTSIEERTSTGINDVYLPPVPKDLEIVKIRKRDNNSFFGKKGSINKKRLIRPQLDNAIKEVTNKEDIYADKIIAQSEEEFKEACSCRSERSTEAVQEREENSEIRARAAPSGSFESATTQGGGKKRKTDNEQMLKEYYKPSKFCPACISLFHKANPKPPPIQELTHELSPLSYCRKRGGLKEDFQVLFPLTVAKACIKVMHYVK